MATSLSTTHKLTAEFLGTFVLVLGGCGTAIFAGEYVGFQGVALAFGLTVVVGAYAFGPISGGHFNPAVTCGLAAAKRFEWKDVPGYVVAQLVGAIVAGLVLFVIANGVDGFVAKDGFASNGYGDHSPGGYNLGSVLLTEFLLTAIFLFIILGASAKRAAVGFAGLTIGLGLTLIHLISIPISNTSVNPARSIGVALFAGGDVIVQQWVFILAPIAGAVVAGALHSMLLNDQILAEAAPE